MSTKDIFLNIRGEHNENEDPRVTVVIASGLNSRTERASCLRRKEEVRTAAADNSETQCRNSIARRTRRIGAAPSKRRLTNHRSAGNLSSERIELRFSAGDRSSQLLWH